MFNYKLTRWLIKYTFLFRLFGTTGYCSACNKVIPAFEMVMRARTNVYHLECFACQQCNHRLVVHPIQLKLRPLGLFLSFWQLVHDSTKYRGAVNVSSRDPQVVLSLVKNTYFQTNEFLLWNRTQEGNQKVLTYTSILYFPI